MARKIGAVVVAVAAVLGMLLWRSSGSSSERRARFDPKAQIGTARAVAASGQDPRTLERTSIAGRITDRSTTRPLVGARVCADGWSDSVPAELLREPTCASTDATGAYRLDKLLAAHYTVTAAATRYRPAVYEVQTKRLETSFELMPGEAKDGVDIALAAGGVEVTGTVSDLTGGPVVKAQVRATVPRWDGIELPPVETDDQGHYALWVQPGLVTVTAHADGYVDASQSVEAPGSLDLFLTPESVVAGTVVDAANGTPIAGANVTVRRSDDMVHDMTDADGKFRIGRLTPDRYVIEARTEHGYGRSAGSTLVGLGHVVDGIVVAIRPARKIEGKIEIKGETNSGCTEGSAWFEDAANDHWAASWTDDDGVISAEGVVPGTYQVTIHCDGHATSNETYEPIVVADRDVTGLTWEVERGATIKGRVLTIHRDPVSNATIRVYSTDDATGSLPRAYATSNLDGSYEISGLHAGSYTLKVADRNAMPDVQTLAAGQVVEKDLVLEDGGGVKGVVVDVRGQPVQDVDVHARPHNADRWQSSSASAKVDAQGRFALDWLPPGTYRVIALRGGETLRKPALTNDQRDQQGEQVTVKLGQTATVRLVVESQSGVINGRVVDAEGKPVSDAFLDATREADAMVAGESDVSATHDWGDDKPAMTNVDGTFVITGLSPGRYKVRAYRKGGASAVAEHVAVGSTVGLQIKRTGSIRGVVKHTNGVPPDDLNVEVANFTAGVFREERFFATAGAFAIHDLPAGRFTVVATTDDGTTKLEIDLGEGENKTDVNIVLESVVTITGRVVDDMTKAPVAGVRVSAHSTSSPGRDLFSTADIGAISETDANGRFTVKRIPRGSIQIIGITMDGRGLVVFGDMTIPESTLSTVDVGDVHARKVR